MRIVAAIYTALIAFGAAAQERYVPYLQQRLLVEVAECASKECVQDTLAGAPYVDPPLKLIAASRIAQIDRVAARPLLLDALPRDPVAFWFCYSVTVPKLGGEFKKVRDLYDSYFPAAAKAAAETGSHVREFLLQQMFADGEMAATIAEDIESLKDRNPAAYCDAIESLHPEVKRSVPGCNSRRSGAKE